MAVSYLSKAAETDQPSVPEQPLWKRAVQRIAQFIFPDRQFISLLKYELSLLCVSVYSKLSPIEWIKRARLDDELKLNIGYGPLKHSRWTNLDCHVSLKKDELACDLRRRWPLRSMSARYIFSEHVFEHFGYPDEIGNVLAECYRVLRPGGVLRIIVPDAERYLQAYANDDKAFLSRIGGPSASKLSVVNGMMRENGFHKYAYDFDELARALRLAGFSAVVKSKLRSSTHPELNIDYDDPERELVSLYVEAIKL